MPSSILNSDDGVISGTSGLKNSGGDDAVLLIQTNGTTAQTVDSGQRTKFPTTIGVGGATPSASGSGISFPATQSASSDANTLDDYEEGTWTPTVRGEGTAGTTTYTLQEGYYTKIGNTVFLYCSVSYSAATGTGPLQIQGVPFNNVDRVTMGAVRTQFLNFPATSTWIVANFQNTSGTINLNGCGDDVNLTEVTLSDESAAIIFQITYRV